MPAIDKPSYGSQTASMAKEAPWPTPTQSVASAKRPFLSSSARNAVSASLAPDAPKGWPRAIAPPLGLTCSASSGRPIWRNTASAWLDLYYQRKMRALLQQQKDEAALPVQAADAAYRGGRGSQADVFAARAAAAQIDDRIAAADREVASARTMLARWTGVATDEILDAPPALDIVRLNEETLDQDIAHHPELAVLVKQEAAAQADADAARANKRPDVSVELSYSQRGPAYSNMVSVGVSIPLQWDQKNRQDRELHLALEFRHGRLLRR